MTIVPTNYHRTREQNENDESDRKLYRFDGRNIERELDNCNAERILGFVQTAFGLNEFDVKYLLKDIFPNVHNQIELKSTFLCLDHGFRHRYVYSKEDLPVGCTDREAQYLFQHTIRREQDIQEKEQELCRVIDHSVRKCAGRVQKFLDDAHVMTFKELFSKSRQIWNLKQKALKIYLRSNENIELRQQIDLATMPQNEETRSCVLAYWRALSENKTMRRGHILIEDLLRAAFIQMRSDFYKIFVGFDEEEQSHQIAIHPGFPTKLFERSSQAGENIFQFVIDQFKAQMRGGDDLSINYLEKKARVVIFERINNKISKLLAAEYEMAKKQYRKYLKQFDRMAADVSKFPERINLIDRLISEIDPNVGDGKEKIQELQSERDICQDCMEFIQQKTPHSYALKKLEEDPESFPPIIDKCKVTETANKLIRVCKCKWGRIQLSAEGGDQLIDPDVHLTISNQQEFIQQLVTLLRQRDIECLNVEKIKKNKTIPAMINCSIL